MQKDERQTHWRTVFTARTERETSWFQEDPQPSLGMIAGLAASSSAIIDIGAGSSHLAGALLERGFTDVTALDVAAPALAAAKARLGAAADHIRWIVADAVTWKPTRTYDVWHDRAAFHFLTDDADRAAYLARLTQALKPGGHAIIATFAPDGPERCSGLPVRRYDAGSLAGVLGPAFALAETRRHVHVTPWGAEQAFQFSVFRALPATRGHDAPSA